MGSQNEIMNELEGEKEREKKECERKMGIFRFIIFMLILNVLLLHKSFFAQ